MNKIQSKTILFITGAFVSSSCWDEWKAFFESHGYKTIAPPWPHKDGTAKELRDNQPNAAIASNRLADLTEYFARIAQSLSEKPIVIGHSIGGLMTQILINRDLAAAGIAIHSVPPQGIVPVYFSFFKATWKALGFFTSSSRAYLMSFKDWQYAFTNGMPIKAQVDGYERFVIPESKLALRDGLTSAAHVDFSLAHAPLLFTAGTNDHCVPAGLNFTNFKKYPQDDSVTEYKVFEGRNHFILGQPTWERDAEYILAWLEKYS